MIHLTSFALLLVIVAAFCHAIWNFLAKKVCGGTTFIWLFTSLSLLIYFPILLWTLFTSQVEFGIYQIAFIVGSAVLHSIYFIMLDKGYQFGDLSVIYPLARGTGPLLSILVAITLLGERPTMIALTGALLIGGGILTITGNPFALKGNHVHKSIYFALLCGTAIAGYTVLDKIAVSTFLLPPLIMDWCSNLGRAILLTPYALKNWDKVRDQWNSHKKEALGVAILSPLAYILVLTAMVFSPVSYIAPAREFSILIGAILGARLLKEGNSRTRLIGAGAMFIGLVALSIG